jgi:hypothetical protein
MAGADRAFLLGGLLELAHVTPGSAEYRRLCGIGMEAFDASPLDGRSRLVVEGVE